MNLAPNRRYALVCCLMAFLIVFVAGARLVDAGGPLPVLEMFVCFVAGVWFGFGMFLAGWAERLLEYRKREAIEESEPH